MINSKPPPPAIFEKENCRGLTFWAGLTEEGFGTVDAPLSPCRQYFIPLPYAPAPRPGLCSSWPLLPVDRAPCLRWRCPFAAARLLLRSSSCRRPRLHTGDFVRPWLLQPFWRQPGRSAAATGLYPRGYRTINRS